MKIIAALCAFFIWAQTGTGYAQTFPDHAVRFIVPNPAGGSNDAAARILANALSELWPHGVVIENRGGGGGNIGAQTVAGSPADGYTFLLTSPGPVTINPSLYKKLPFDPAKDFVPIALVATVPIVLMVNPKVPADSVMDLIALARRESGKLHYASTGIGSTHHLSTELFASMAGIKLFHVPYRGAAPAMNDLIAGHVPILFDNLSTVVPQVRAGNVRALAVATLKRVPLLPDVPTFAEAGLPGFEASSWFGLLAPAGLPADIIAKVIASVQKVLAQPAVKKGFEQTGAEAGDRFGNDFGRFLQDETKKWAKVVKASGATASD